MQRLIFALDSSSPTGRTTLVASHTVCSYSFQMYAPSGQAMEEWMIGLATSIAITHTIALKKAARITAAVPSGAPITPGTDESVCSSGLTTLIIGRPRLSLHQLQPRYATLNLVLL